MESIMEVIDKWNDSALNKNLGHIRRSLPIISLWDIWKSRNDAN